MLQHPSLRLKLSKEKQEQLQQDNTLFLEAIESKNRGVLTPSFYKDFKEKLLAALMEQEGFAEILKAANGPNHQQLYLIHENNRLLNLPWHLATEDIPQLFIANAMEGKEPTVPFTDIKALPLKVLVMMSSPLDAHFKNRLSYEGYFRSPTRADP